MLWQWRRSIKTTSKQPFRSTEYPQNEASTWNKIATKYYSILSFQQWHWEWGLVNLEGCGCLAKFTRDGLFWDVAGRPMWHQRSNLGLQVWHSLPRPNAIIQLALKKTRTCVWGALMVERATTQPGGSNPHCTHIRKKEQVPLELLGSRGHSWALRQRRHMSN